MANATKTPKHRSAERSTELTPKSHAEAKSHQKVNGSVPINTTIGICLVKWAELRSRKTRQVIIVNYLISVNVNVPVNMPERRSIMFDHKRLQVYQVSTDFIAHSDEIAQQLPHGRGNADGAGLWANLFSVNVNVPVNMPERGSIMFDHKRLQVYQDSTDFIAHSDEMCNSFRMVEGILLINSAVHQLQFRSTLPKMLGFGQRRKNN